MLFILQLKLKPFLLESFVVAFSLQVNLSRSSLLIWFSPYFIFKFCFNILRLFLLIFETTKATFTVYFVTVNDVKKVHMLGLGSILGGVEPADAPLILFQRTGIPFPPMRAQSADLRLCACYCVFTVCMFE